MTTYFNYPSAELQAELSSIAKAIAAPGKGILVRKKNNHQSFYHNGGFFSAKKLRNLRNQKPGFFFFAPRKC